MFFFFFQAEDGIRDLVRSRGLGDVYKRQVLEGADPEVAGGHTGEHGPRFGQVAAHGLAGGNDLSLIHI